MSTQRYSYADHHAISNLLAGFLDSISSDAVLLILPPFAGFDRPSLGLHTLQACASSCGRQVRVLYANLLFARLLGEIKYQSLCYAPTADLLGERVFAVAAYGARYPGWRSEEKGLLRTALRAVELVDDDELEALQLLACDFAFLLAEALAKRDFPIVGCNSTFEQTSASIAILSELKRLNPAVITLMGGSNCEGEMARGILNLSPAIDYVFSGESEASFPNFVRNFCTDIPPSHTVVEGEPCLNLDAIPELDYSDYYLQLANFSEQGGLRETGSIWLPYEASRGCWWGQKHHCTFCGINGEGMIFRQKSPDVVLKQLPELLRHHPTNKVLMVDNIMPSNYFQTLLPRLAELALGMHAFYEQKANLSLRRVELIKAAGIAVIQPGIEALSSDLLRLVKKGVSAKQNLALLRYARSVELSINWNLLYAFPGDKEGDYEKTLLLLPLVTHLNPPSGACHLSIDRFSPYFDHAADYGITNVRPMDAYRSIFPATVDTSSIAYHFIADYDTAIRRDRSIVPRLEAHIEAWRAAWSCPERKAPMLAIEQVCENLYLLCDTRSADCSHHKLSFLTEDQVQVALAETSSSDVPEPLKTWALEEARVAIQYEGHLIPLATARSSLIAQFEERSLKPPRRVISIMASE